METLDHEPGERLPTYLARALVYVRDSGSSIACVFDGVAFKITPQMSTDEAHRAWLAARVNRR